MASAVTALWQGTMLQQWTQFQWMGGWWRSNDWLLARYENLKGRWILILLDRTAFPVLYMSKRSPATERIWKKSKYVQVYAILLSSIQLLSLLQIHLAKGMETLGALSKGQKTIDLRLGGIRNLSFWSSLCKYSLSAVWSSFIFANMRSPLKQQYIISCLWGVIA